MTKLIAALTAIAHAIRAVLEAIGRYEIKKQRADYEQDIQDIRSDPVGYANSKFGGVRDSEAKASDMYGNDSAGAGDPVSQRSGNHFD